MPLFGVVCTLVGVSTGGSAVGSARYQWHNRTELTIHIVAPHPTSFIPTARNSKENSLFALLCY